MLFSLLSVSLGQETIFFILSPSPIFLNCSEIFSFCLVGTLINNTHINYVVYALELLLALITIWYTVPLHGHWSRCISFKSMFSNGQTWYENLFSERKKRNRKFVFWKKKSNTKIVTILDSDCNRCKFRTELLFSMFPNYRCCFRFRSYRFRSCFRGKI
jgi:O-antigen/teichoic acid export membrane protein